jgi:coenzyme F420-0:L-glutamate ligase
MQILPFKTRVLTPPQDDLAPELLRLASQLQDRDVVMVSSKVVAISEGRCVPIEGADKRALAMAEADVVIERPYLENPLMIAHHAFIGSAGIDESNADGHYVLLPRDPFASARDIHAQLREATGHPELAVVITDSRSMPLRYGAMGVAIGWWGLEPQENHIGKPDLFGREFRYERSNVVDELAAAANLVMGETDECTPIAIARDVPGLRFTDEDTRAKIMCPMDTDRFRVLYDRFLPGGEG